MLRPMGVKLEPVRIDQDGLIPEALEAKVKKCPSGRVLYSIPTGQNPSGASLTPERKRAIYEIACRHNLLIVEDDPYWYLQLDQERRDKNVSFLSMDVEGRVLRMDSFSKVISAGLRLGLATGPAPLVEKMQIIQQCTSLHPSGLSQTILLSVLEHWGQQGLAQHIDGIQHFYRTQRNHFLRALQTHLEGLVDYTVPNAGMFFWLNCKGIQDADAFLKTHAREAKVLAVSGQAFSPDNLPSSFIRTSFSTASPQEMDTACLRLRNLLLTHGSK